MTEVITMHAAPELGRATPPFSGAPLEPSQSATAVLKSVVDIGLSFKVQGRPFDRRLESTAIRDRLVDKLPAAGAGLTELVDQFRSEVLPLCKNEASPRFLGFGDTGDDPAALAGGILAMLTQQNLINQSFDSPSATFVEIAVLRWIRDLIGYTCPPIHEVTSVWSAGGVVTTGGTMSNTVAMMLARERKFPGAMQHGVIAPRRCAVVVPRGIGHYSVRAALTWIGCGNTVIEADTDGFRYDLQALRRTLAENREDVMAVVAYAGDSRTQTVEDLRAVQDVVRAEAPAAWLHADACWGFQATFSPVTMHLVDGIELYDSVTVDPHKVMAVPYAVSALVTRDVEALRAITSHSDLIMQEDFAFGQVTPFVGSKPWSSLKLWMMMRAHGRDGLASLVEHRLATMAAFIARVDNRPRFIRLHDPDLTACAFLWLPPGTNLDAPDLDAINTVNKTIHAQLLADGDWYLHQFSVPDPGILRRDARLEPLRFMSVNPRITTAHIEAVLDEVDRIGMETTSKEEPR